MRQNIGRVLCAGLGAFYMAGAVPLFNFGETGKWLWSFIEPQIAALAAAAGISPWLAVTLISPFLIAGPMALVWLIAGRGINRIIWFLGGIVAYGVWWMYGR